MFVYENVFIGNFLYSLGFSICAKSNEQSIPSVVSLLQQTPADKPLGDLILEFPGTLRLIEFKRKGNPSSKEIVKHKRISQVVHSEKGLEHDLLSLCRETHWYVDFDTVTDDERIKVQPIPYIDAFSDTTENTEVSLEDFVESTASDACKKQGNYSRTKLRAYLELLSDLNGISGKKSNADTGGIIISASSTAGIAFLRFSSVLDLQLQHAQVVQDFAQKIQRKVDRERDISLDRGRDTGLSR